VKEIKISFKTMKKQKVKIINQIKSTNEYLKFHKRVVHENGNQWLITASTLGARTLVDADCIFGPDKGQFINLIASRSNQSKTIRQNIGMNLIS
jgi:hypothetical protein